MNSAMRSPVSESLCDMEGRDMYLSEEEQARMDKRNADMEAGWIYGNYEQDEIDIREWVHKDDAEGLESALGVLRDKARQSEIEFPFAV